MNKNKEDIRNSFLVDKDKIIYFKDCSKELQLKIINEINNSQKPLKDYKNGIYSIQTFGKLSFLYPGE